jgi:hypothetical protein
MPGIIVAPKGVISKDLQLGLYEIINLYETMFLVSHFAN